MLKKKKEKKSTGMQFNKPKKTTNREEKFNFFFSICISSQKPYTGFFYFFTFKTKKLYIKHTFSYKQTFKHKTSKCLRYGCRDYKSVV